MSQTAQSQQIRKRIAQIALLAALCLPVYFMIAALGVKFGFWGYQFGLGVMVMKWAGLLIMAVLAVTLIALISIAVKSPRDGIWAALLALFIILLIGGRMAGLSMQAKANPFHDAQTDWSKPIAFSEKLMALRGGKANPVLDAPLLPKSPLSGDKAGTPVADMQAQIAPDLQTLLIKGWDQVTAHQVALAVVKGRGWDIVQNDSDSGVIEATATSFWFGFKDDIAIRITPIETGIAIDARSVSRVGMSDLGMNTKRVRALISGIRTKLQFDTKAGLAETNDQPNNDES